MKFNILYIILGFTAGIAWLVYVSRPLTSMPEPLTTVNIQKSVLFAHNSIGNNIIWGISDVITPYSYVTFNNNYPLNDIKITGPGIFGYELGNNGDPEGKLKAFERLLDTVPGIEVAIFKFCYVDMTADTDPQKLFNTYKIFMDRIADKHPNIVIIHTTMPITTRDIKQKIKSVYNKTGDIIRHKRWVYNDLIRKQYKISVFDIALFESRLTKDTFRMESKDYPVLFEGYTTDGGHLNKVGSAVLAKELLLYLDSFLSSKES